MPVRSNERLILCVFLLGIFSFIIEFLNPSNRFLLLGLSFLEWLVMGLFVLEIVRRFWLARLSLNLVRRNIFDLALVIFFGFTIWAGHRGDLIDFERVPVFIVNIILIRYLFHLLHQISRFERVNAYLKRIFYHPALTIAASFLVVILFGTLILMMPFASSDGVRLNPLDALFTATSAVCVTGLIVVDTATRFSLYGKIVIMGLIQIGGLGIMILAYFAAYLMGRRISIEEKLTMSYFLNDQEVKKVTGTITWIILFTLIIESLGASLLYRFFLDWFNSHSKALIYAVFHSVSAFCNAGFALFSNNLEGFQSSVFLNIVICSLIIAGGLSFIVLVNLLQTVYVNIRNALSEQKIQRIYLSLNSKAVLIVTVILLISGTVFVYVLEHRTTLINLALGTQYLTAFFQSVTLRTAGFNTINIGGLRTGTLLLMVVLMFIGGAAGSTAGGIKVNTVFVVFAYLKSIITGKSEILIMNQALGRELVIRAFLIIIISLIIVTASTMAMTLCEPYALEKILFEVVSAFGTVGLSTGITPDLSGWGKLILIMTMFIGRAGPLTMMFALFPYRTSNSAIKYPEGTIIF